MIKCPTSIFPKQKFYGRPFPEIPLGEDLEGGRETIEGSMASTRIRPDEEMWVCLWGDEGRKIGRGISHISRGG